MCSCDDPFSFLPLYWSDSAEGMKAGNYGNLLVLIEQPRGEYAVTIAYLRLVTTLVKVTRTQSHTQKRHRIPAVPEMTKLVCIMFRVCFV